MGKSRSNVENSQVLNAFQTLVPRSSNPDSHRAPAKRGPKPSPNGRAVISLMTEGERRAARILRDNKNQFSINQETQEDRDKQNMLLGRSFEGRRA